MVAFYHLGKNEAGTIPHIVLAGYIPNVSNIKLLKKKKKEKKERNYKNTKGGRGFPGDAVVKNPPANAGNTGSSPGLGRSYMPQSN